MKACVWSLLCALLATACVLPDYDVETSKDRERDASADTGPTGATSAEQMVAILPNAEPECASCAKDNCVAEREACGADCADFKWPVSPAWQVSSDKADAYVRCLARQCDAQCGVLWGCAKNYVFPEARDASVTIRVTDAAMPGLEIEGIRVKACQDLDPSCQSAIGEASTAVTNAAGRAVLALPPSFEGYFFIEQAEPSADGNKYVPMTVVWSQPLYKIESLLTVSIFKEGLIPALASTAEKVLPGKGHMVFKAQNCLPQRYVDNPELNADAEGVIANYAPRGDGSRVYYTRNGLKISPEAENTSVDGAGFGGAFNLSPGSVSVTGVHEDVEVSNAVYTVRRDTLGIVFLLPKPR
jgi:hypothetical protein